MTDFRELCAELVTELEKWCGTYSSTEDFQSVISRARAALAEPEPEGPTDEELDYCANELLDWNPEGIRTFARTVLARWGNNTSRSN